MENMAKSINFEHGKKNNAHIITNVNLGLNSYETLCLICAELNINFDNISDNDFSNTSELLKMFCNSCNDATGYTVSVWFD
jgi:hypothetical protein